MARPPGPAGCRGRATTVLAARRPLPRGTRRARTSTPAGCRRTPDLLALPVDDASQMLMFDTLVWLTAACAAQRWQACHAPGPCVSGPSADPSQPVPFADVLPVFSVEFVAQEHEKPAEQGRAAGCGSESREMRVLGQVGEGEKGLGASMHELCASSSSADPPRRQPLCRRASPWWRPCRG